MDPLKTFISLLGILAIIVVVFLLMTLSAHLLGASDTLSVILGAFVMLASTLLGGYSIYLIAKSKK